MSGVSYITITIPRLRSTLRRAQLRFVGGASSLSDSEAEATIQIVCCNKRLKTRGVHPIALHVTSEQSPEFKVPIPPGDSSRCSVWVRQKQLSLACRIWTRGYLEARATTDSRPDFFMILRSLIDRGLRCPSSHTLASNRPRLP